MVGGWKNKTFTEALWKAILLTKNTRWVRNGKAAPQTAIWDEWLFQAESKAKSAGSRIDTIDDPLWPSKAPFKGTVWDQPKDWNAKTAWDDIDTAYKGNDKGGLPPAQAV